MRDPFRVQVAGLPDQLEMPPAGEGVLPGWRRLWVAGMGGSASAGDFLSLGGADDREVNVVRDRELPPLREGDALVCISHSGETAETLAVWKEAGQVRLPRAAVGSGGTLARAAREAGAPWRATPGELAPRAALGALLRGAAAVAGMEAAFDWAEAVRILRERVGPEGPGEELERMADALVGHLPVLLPARRGAEVAARRWVSDLAENAKTPALLWALPEAAHNQVMAAARSAPGRESLAVVALGSRRGDPSTWEALLDSLPGHGVRPLRVEGTQARPWIEALELAHLGSWTSVLLAERLGVAAADLSLMDDLKRILHRGKEASR